jgi:hypothetical protein
MFPAVFDDLSNTHQEQQQEEPASHLQPQPIVDSNALDTAPWWLPSWLLVLISNSSSRRKRSELLLLLPNTVSSFQQ